jgi:hypothetical protein
MGIGVSPVPHVHGGRLFADPHLNISEGTIHGIESDFG